MATEVRGYWSDIRLNGKPVEPGTYYWVTEMDGINPIGTMGKTVQEVLNKITSTLGHAQSALARKAMQIPAAMPGAVAPAAPAQRKRMSSDEIFQATADMSNPAKSADAVVKLVSDTTGIDLRKLVVDRFRDMALEWQEEHPEFYVHAGNIELLGNEAHRSSNNDTASITKETLTAAFNKLRAQGKLFEAPISFLSNEQEPTDPPNNLHEFPGGSPVQRTEMPRGARFATGTRSTNFRASQERQPRTPKYSPEDIRRMPPSKHKELINSNDPDYAAAVELMARAQASA